MEAVKWDVRKEIGDFADTAIAHVQFDTVEELAGRLKSTLGSTTYDCRTLKRCMRVYTVL